MKKVEGFILVEITEVQNGYINRKLVSRAIKKRREVPIHNLEKIMARHEDLSGLGDDVLKPGIRNLGQAYELYKGRTREVYGEIEIKQPESVETIKEEIKPKPQKRKKTAK